MTYKESTVSSALKLVEISAQFGRSNLASKGGVSN